MTGEKAPVMLFAGRAEFAEWLAGHYDTSDGVWLKLAKKSAPTPTVTYAEALEVALCHGWIDGQKASLDEAYWLQRFTPRRARSRWSMINRDKALALIARGEMRPAGLRAIEAAQADGRWDAAYASPAVATVPADLAAALAENPVAEAFFATLRSSNRFAIIHRVEEAKRPETRARRIAQYVALCAAHQTIT